MPSVTSNDLFCSTDQSASVCRFGLPGGGGGGGGGWGGGGGGGEPLRVGRPGVIEGDAGPVERGRCDLRRRAGGDVEHVQRLRVVDVADVRSVRRPFRILVETGAGHFDPARLAAAVLIGDAQLVLAALVGE